MMVDRSVFLLSKEKAQKVFNKFHLGKVETIKSLSHLGINNHSFVINDKFVLRISRRDDSYNLDLERFLYKQIYQRFKDFPIPSVLAYDNSCDIIKKPYQILTKIKGSQLSIAWKKMSLKQKEEIGREFGRLISKIHSIYFIKIGYFRFKKTKGVIGNVKYYETWLDFIKEDYDHDLSIIKKFKVINKNTLYNIERYFYENKNLLDINFRPCIIHNDLNLANFNVYNNQISGIFDFEWAFSGHNEYELAKIEYSVFKKFPEIKEPFFKEYLKVHMKSAEYLQRTKFYRFWSLLMWIAGIYEDSEPQNPKVYIKELINIIKEKGG